MQSVQTCLGTLAKALPGLTDCTLMQTRQYKAVVVNGNVTKAIRLLNTHIKEEKLIDKRRASQVYMKPSHQRVIKQKETEKRLSRQNFKAMMYWVMQAKSRLVVVPGIFIRNYLCKAALNCVIFSATRVQTL